MRIEEPGLVSGQSFVPRELKQWEVLRLDCSLNYLGNWVETGKAIVFAPGIPLLRSIYWGYVRLNCTGSLPQVAGSASARSFFGFGLRAYCFLHSNYLGSVECSQSFVNVAGLTLLMKKLLAGYLWPDFDYLTPPIIFGFRVFFKSVQTNIVAFEALFFGWSMMF